PGARQQAAIEILTSLETERRPAADAVKAWMLTHRFAGSKDRAEIGDLVFGALRWKQSSAWRFKQDTPRARVWRSARRRRREPRCARAPRSARQHVENGA